MQNPLFGDVVSSEPLKYEEEMKLLFWINLNCFMSTFWDTHISFV